MLLDILVQLNVYSQSNLMLLCSTIQDSQDDASLSTWPWLYMHACTYAHMHICTYAHNAMCGVLTRCLLCFTRQSCKMPVQVLHDIQRTGAAMDISDHW